MSIKSTWKQTNWVQKLQLILLTLMLPLLIIIAADNWMRHVSESSPEPKTTSAEQAMRQSPLRENTKR